MEQLFTFVETTDFQESIPELFGDDDEYAAFQAFLCKNPTAGASFVALEACGRSGGRASHARRGSVEG